ncbi:MAG: sugar ABC transporter permease [Treponema sp.]|jgi:multiple sugar transport system permease protein|nr:sugar ABC transporter permease [Treponema sp.]
MDVRKKSRMLANEQRWGYFFIAPQFIGLVLFSVIPVVQSLGISFTEWNILNPPVMVGLANYKKLLANPFTWKLIGNTAYFIIGHIIVTTTLALLVAMALSNDLKGYVVYRTLYFLPNVTSTVAISLVWQWIFHPDYGLVNAALANFGIPAFGWYTSMEGAMPTLILLTVWQMTGYYMVIFLAGLNGISRTYYEAAKIDGANKVQVFSRITLPLLTPTLLFILTMMFIGGFQIFNEPYMLTRGGPADATKTIVLEIYNTAFLYFRMGDAAVYSWLLFVIIFIVTVIQFKFSSKWVNYDV